MHEHHTTAFSRTRRNNFGDVYGSYDNNDNNTAASDNDHDNNDVGDDADLNR